MSKYIFFLVIFVLLLAPVALARDETSSQAQTQTTAQKTIKAGGQDQEQAKEQTETKNQGETIKIQVQTEAQEKAKTTAELKEQEQERAQKLEQELQAQQEGEEIKEILRNQNPVRLAVYSLLAMENLIGGIGQQVSAIAREFNNSIQGTLVAEAKIKSRGFWQKIFWGGDKEAAADLEDEIRQNEARIQELLNLQNRTQLKQEIEEQLQVQIQTLKQEQDRLTNLAQQETSKVGFFGWVKKIFR
ncbi:MAG: hypothetical protein COU85_01090 [Candidatus Portnoybacteria bacterium CG10_big_fil_rev_8_21_14_0_10_44_7]|uniref:DUF5667 domain-containing protein n=1 Tax=Candidatus Portnoybacteria bacterium CG10_big_fil_rev_8_21_14_0_10_44_7 TaxID=1974816 RepID=A0A2M8KJ19_9BACT|nr:MAG: hypothetical protein COU85_01090 [Candidatus Portnoybacteria bacterium CG10_big_fil_rev_8_21_14_0_10_44_7]